MKYLKLFETHEPSYEDKIEALRDLGLVPRPYIYKVEFDIDYNWAEGYGPEETTEELRSAILSSGISFELNELTASGTFQGSGVKWDRPIDEMTYDIEDDDEYDESFDRYSFRGLVNMTIVSTMSDNELGEFLNSDEDITKVSADEDFRIESEGPTTGLYKNNQH
jgi:hypothetical protein